MSLELRTASEAARSSACDEVYSVRACRLAREDAKAHTIEAKALLAKCAGIEVCFREYVKYLHRSKPDVGDGDGDDGAGAPAPKRPRPAVAPVAKAAFRQQHATGSTVCELG